MRELLSKLGEGKLIMFPQNFYGEAFYVAECPDGYDLLYSYPDDEIANPVGSLSPLGSATVVRLLTQLCGNLFSEEMSCGGRHQRNNFRQIQLLRLLNISTMST